MILGWNDKAAAIIEELGHYVAPGSAVLIAAEGEKERRERIKLGIGRNQTVQYHEADITDREVLEDLLRQRDYDHLILLSYDHLEVQAADAATLITLLHLRDIAEKSGKRLSIVSEMRDIRNRNLAEIAKVNDFIVSDKLISLLITQISENKRLNTVFADIFDADGSEIYVKRAADYVRPGVPVNFYTLLEAASRRHEVAMGYKIAAEANNPERSYGVHLNPKKSERIVLGERDCLIVLAEE